jgi:hypothetical protein
MVLIIASKSSSHPGRSLSGAPGVTTNLPLSCQSPTRLAAYVACASVNCSPAFEDNCWTRLAREKPLISRYDFTDSTASLFQSTLMWLTANTASALLNPSPAFEESCWIKPARLKPDMSR